MSAPIPSVPDMDLGATKAETEFNSGRQRNNLRRDLSSVHIVFITISGLLGSGLYIRSGTVLRLGGPAAVLVAYAVLGFLAMFIMFAIGEMICIWPISNALVQFPRQFIDEELGTVVGIAYWLSWSSSFALLIVLAATEARYWTCSADLAFLLGPPVVLFLWACFPVRWYGWSEVVAGAIKLVFVVFIIACMIAINIGVPPLHEHIGIKNFAGDPLKHDPDQAKSEGAAIFVALQVAAYSFIGVEVPAVIAAEALVDTPGVTDSRLGKYPAAKALKFSVAYLPMLVGVVYFVNGLLAALNVNWTEGPSQDWLGNDPCKKGYSPSVFVIAAQGSQIPGLPSAFVGIMVFSAWSCANTCLFVASRTLHGLTQGSQIKAISWIARTEHKIKSPYVALLISAIAFIWIPLIHVAGGQWLTLMTDILSGMSSISAVLVWTCECYAYIRFHKYLTKFKREVKNKAHLHDPLGIERQEVDPESPFAHLSRWHNASSADGSYPFRSPFQPVLTWIAFVGCSVGIICMAASAWLWHGWHGSPETNDFVSAYVVLVFYAVLWMCLKLSRCGLSWKKWTAKYRQLKDKDGFIQTLEYLFDITAGQRVAPQGGVSR